MIVWINRCSDSKQTFTLHTASQRTDPKRKMGGDKKKKAKNEVVEGTIEKLRKEVISEVRSTEDAVNTGIERFSGEMMTSQRDLEAKVVKLSAEAEVRINLLESRDCVSHASLDKRLEAIRAGITEEARKFQAQIREELKGDQKKAG